MFKSGDKIVYLRDKLNILNHQHFNDKYKLKNLYDIKPFYIYKGCNSFNEKMIYLEDFDVRYIFDADDFITIQEYRKLKLNKIKNEYSR